MKKNFNKSWGVVTALSLLVLFTPEIALCADQDVIEIYNYINGWYWSVILPVGSTLAGFVIMYAGISYSLSGGDASKVGRAKELIFGAISGLALLVLAAFIVRMITT